MDPAHIVPSRTDSGSNGHFSQGQQSQQGTPRGFNLQNIPGGAPTWSGVGGATAAMQGLSGFDGAGGPMRRGAGGMSSSNGRYNASYRSGPYDRRPGGRFDSPGGGSPGGGMRGKAGTGPGVANGAGRWGDGGVGAAGGGMGATGPKEAVAGRSLRSYEDLDAAGGVGGELNY